MQESFSNMVEMEDPNMVGSRMSVRILKRAGPYDGRVVLRHDHTGWVHKHYGQFDRDTQRDSQHERILKRNGQHDRILKRDGQHNRILKREANMAGFLKEMDSMRGY